MTTTNLKAAFAKRFDHLSDAERAAKAARLRKLLGQVKATEHAMKNTAARMVQQAAPR